MRDANEILFVIGVETIALITLLVVIFGGR